MQVTIYVDDNQFWKRVKQFAHHNQLSVSQLIKKALLYYMAGQ